MTDDKELMMWGRHIMMGYAYREDATRKDMTEDGWLRTGDLVDIDSDGSHFIVGREKDLIITAGGENIAPQPIHCAVKAKLPVISQVLLLGDKKKFCSDVKPGGGRTHKCVLAHKVGGVLCYSVCAD